MPNIKKSISQHLAQGTYRADRHGDVASELKIREGIPPCPDYLDEIAAKEWDRVVGLFKDSGVLRATDSTVLSIYCGLYSELVKEGVAGMQAARLTQFRLVCQELGLSPVSRARIKTDGRDESINLSDPYLEF